MKRPEIEPNLQPQVLGTINPSITSPEPLAPKFTVWESEDGAQVSMQEPPPPWEVSGQGERPDSDARKFVTVPDNWVLRWVNPKLLDQFGWRDWEPVMASDPRVKVHVRTMVSVENNIRRGGQTGDILCWMYRSWVESRRRQLKELTDKQTESARNRFQQTREDILRGAYGRGVTLEESRHPSNTIADGREMRERGD